MKIKDKKKINENKYREIFICEMISDDFITFNGITYYTKVWTIEEKRKITNDRQNLFF